MGPNGVSDQLLGRFTPVLLQSYLFIKITPVIKNDPDWCSRWWDLADWQWKVGITLRAIRHGPPCLQIESSGVMNSYLWVLSLEFTNLVGHTQFTFLKYPCLGRPATPSGIMLKFAVTIRSVTGTFQSCLNRFSHISSKREKLRDVLLGVNGSAGGWQCCWGAPNLPHWGIRYFCVFAKHVVCKVHCIVWEWGISVA
jgi:hypothetical protein